MKSDSDSWTTSTDFQEDTGRAIGLGTLESSMAWPTNRVLKKNNGQSQLPRPSRSGIVVHIKCCTQSWADSWRFQVYDWNQNWFTYNLVQTWVKESVPFPFLLANRTFLSPIAAFTADKIPRQPRENEDDHERSGRTRTPRTQVKLARRRRNNVSILARRLSLSPPAASRRLTFSLYWILNVESHRGRREQASLSTIMATGLETPLASSRRWAYT